MNAEVKRCIEDLKELVNGYFPPLPSTMEAHPDPNVEFGSVIERLEYELSRLDLDLD